MDGGNIGFWDQVALYLALVGAWLAGEAGRALLAGAAGGLVRWLMSERRRLRDGVVSVCVGVLMAKYASPIMQVMLEGYFGALQPGVKRRPSWWASLSR